MLVYNIENCAIGYGVAVGVTGMGVTVKVGVKAGGSVMSLAGSMVTMMPYCGVGV
jgi:hypothetical protein